MFPLWSQATFWGLVAGSALLAGAAIGWFLIVPRRVIGTVMAFGSGVLISALSFELMNEAYRRGGLMATATGFFGGAIVYTLANWWLARRGARHRKRSREQPFAGDETGDSGLAIAAGALLDGIPESIVIGLGMVAGGGVSAVTVTAVFLSNVPEGLSSAVGMKRAGRTRTYVFGVWGGITIVSGVAALIGYTAFRQVPPHIIAATTAIAAGAILAMIADTMIPEAFEEVHEFTGIAAVSGFLAAFALGKLGG